MAGRATTKITTARDGRLPTPSVEWPISQESFARLADRWRESRVWLSLWNGEGRDVTFDSQGGRLWTTFWSHGEHCEHFRQELGTFARAVIEADATGCGQSAREDSRTSGTAGDLDLGPWQPDLGVIAVPVRWRHRAVGVVLGGVVFSDRPGEAFTRLCARCGVDREVMVRFASEAGVTRMDEIRGIARLLDLSVELAREVEVGREETEILTNNLENTYEELNLIYEISGKMRLPRKSSQVFGDVGREVLEVSRAAAVAFVLHEQDRSSHSAGAGTGPATRQLADQPVQIGEGAPDLRDLDRLAKALNISEASSPNHVLLNEAYRRPALEWAKGWLEHLVALPLWHEQQLLGVMFAINCRDEGDFTSVDAQLFRAVADRVAAFLENQRLYDDLADLLMGLLHALVNSIDAKDPYTCGHSERVACFSRAVAQAAGLSPVECERVYLGGLLHDAGKIGVPDAVLCKPGKLTKEEFDAMKKHPEIGAKILSRVRQVADLIPGVLHHHERMDGRGYPGRLPGGSIPPFGRIICLADCFDAMTSSRTYRTALPLPVAVAEIRRCSGTQFDPRLAELFLRLDLRGLLEEARASSGVAPVLGHARASNAEVDSWSGSREPVRVLS
ncbi:MAG: HD domain-containing protein [Phycisphaerae bacterium]|nr:HD domain-containing protein [Phycisphaerae bacterium]